MSEPTLFLIETKSRPWAWGADADQGVTLTGSKADDVVVEAFPASPRDDSDHVLLVDPTFRRRICAAWSMTTSIFSVVMEKRWTFCPKLFGRKVLPPENC
jgi:hypothetical protein